MNLPSNLTDEEKAHFEEGSAYAEKMLAIYEPFFIYPLYNLEITAVKSTAHGKSRAITDGRKIEFQYPAALTLVNPTFAGLKHHELQHVTNLHLPRSVGKNHFIWNVACDISVNEVVAKLESRTKNRIMWAVGGIRIPKLAHLSVDEIYKELMREEGDDDFKTDSANGTFEYRDENGQWQQVHDDSMDFQFTGQDMDTLKQEQLQMLRGARVAYGSLGSGVDRVVTDMLDSVRVDWKAELRKYISSFQQDFSFQYRDRRFETFKYFIPGQEATANGSLKVKVGIDLSGSITLEDIKKMVTECIGIQRTYRETEFTFIPFDVDTYGEFKAKGADGIMAAFSKFRGGGGTSFVKVLEALDTKNTAVILMFTDLRGRFPTNKPKANVVWIDISGTYDKPVPFGKVVRYE